jgi:putative transposase
MLVRVPVAENVLNRQFAPRGPNQVWGTDITYLWTQEGWVYLAVVIDLYSRRVVGWAMDRRMKKALVIRALLMAINLRQPPPGLLHHSDRGSQYASHAYQALLKQNGMVSSMSRKGTHVSSLGSYSSTIELHPRDIPPVESAIYTNGWSTSIPKNVTT